MNKVKIVVRKISQKGHFNGDLMFVYADVKNEGRNAFASGEGHCSYDESFYKDCTKPISDSDLKQAIHTIECIYKKDEYQIVKKRSL